MYLLGQLHLIFFCQSQCFFCYFFVFTYEHIFFSRSGLDLDNAIAIVGVGGKFPGAETVDDFWRVLVNGENHVVEIPPERWNVEEYYSADYDEPGKTYVRRGGFLSKYVYV